MFCAFCCSLDIINLDSWLGTLSLNKLINHSEINIDGFMRKTIFKIINVQPAKNEENTTYVNFQFSTENYNNK